MKGFHDIRPLLLKSRTKDCDGWSERAGVRRRLQKSLSGLANTESLSRRPKRRQQTNDGTGGGRGDVRERGGGGLGEMGWIAGVESGRGHGRVG
jgi:hypothetical protein